jgi:hypothetical protein
MTSDTSLLLMPGNSEGEGNAPSGEAGQHSPTGTLSGNDETKEEDDPAQGKSRHHPRQLTGERALEIFKLRPQLKGPIRRGSMLQCKAIAPLFGVSPKTVREIWAGRAWARATRTEWTDAEIETRVSSISLAMRDDSAGGASNVSDAISLLRPTTNNDARSGAVTDSLRIPALQHSLSAAPSLQTLLAAAAYAPQQLALQQLQPTAPQAHTSSTAQLLAQVSDIQTPPPHTAWGSGAATQLTGANNFELAQVQATNQAQHRFLQQEVHHFLQQYELG